MATGHNAIPAACGLRPGRTHFGHSSCAVRRATPSRPRRGGGGGLAEFQVSPRDDFFTRRLADLLSSREPPAWREVPACVFRPSRPLVSLAGDIGRPGRSRRCGRGLFCRTSPTPRPAVARGALLPIWWWRGAVGGYCGPLVLLTGSLTGSTPEVTRPYGAMRSERAWQWRDGTQLDPDVCQHQRHIYIRSPKKGVSDL